MTRNILSFGLYLLAVLLVLAALLLTLASFVLKDLKHYTEATLKLMEARTGYMVSVGDINWSIAKGAGLRIDNLRIIDASHQTLLLSVKKVHLLTSFTPLLRKRISVSRFILDEPEIHVVRTPEGFWQLPALPPVQLADSSARASFFDFSMVFKRLYVNNGRIIYGDNLYGTAARLEKLNITLDLDRRTRVYSITADARLEDAGPSGRIGVEATIRYPSTGLLLNDLHADGRIVLKSIALDAVAPYLQHLPFANMQARVDADLSLSIRPGLKFAGQCRLTASSLSCVLEPGSPLNLDGSSLQCAFQADSDSLSSDRLSISLPDGVNLKGRCQLSGLREPNPLCDLALSSEAFGLPAVKRYAMVVLKSASPYKALAEKITQGRFTVDELHLREHLGQPWTFHPSVLQAALSVEDVTLATWDQAPALVITEGLLKLDTDRLQGTLRARWPDSDNHTVHVDIPGLFRAPAPEISVDSRIAAQSLARLMPLVTNSPAANFALQAASGTVTAHSRLWYQQNLMIKSEIDLTQAGYQIADLAAKPAGLGNRLSLEWSAGVDQEPAPLRFGLLLEDKAVISGTVDTWSPPSLQGNYVLKGLDLTTITLPSMPSGMMLKGVLSGSGTFGYPPVSAAQALREGTLSLEEFSLFDKEADAALISGDLNAILAPQQIDVTARSGRVGLTDLGFTGTLTKLLPPAGRLSIEAGTLDIDDFVQNIQRIVQLRGKQPQQPAPSEPGIIRRTDLDMGLKVQRISFLKWNGDNATSDFTFKYGSMRWDDITIHTDNGTIHGSVAFDFSRHPDMTLALAPSRSDVDFLWCVPGLRKGETITGTTNLAGEFSSTFRQTNEIVPNMQGRFHIAIARGEIRKFAFLAKILTMLNIPRLFELKLPDLMSQGMPFDVLTADFTMRDTSMRTKNLVIKGPAMNLSAVGSINLSQEKIDLIIAAQPLETIGKIMGKIPVAKSIFTGKDKSLTVGYFHVTGPYEDASVRPLPLKSLSAAVRRLFNSIIDIPRDIFAPQHDKAEPPP